MIKRLSVTILFVSLIFAFFVCSPAKILADPIPPAGGAGSGSGLVNLGTIKITVLSLGELVGNLYLVALFAASLFFFIQLLVGGISWMGAGGDPKAMTSARNRLMNAIIGLVIVVAAFAISVIVTSALGINIFTNPVKIGQ